MRFVEEFPLRGHLACVECLQMGDVQLVTGSRSRSKTGMRYAYYHCHACGEYRVRADAANEAVQAFLACIQIAPPVVRLYRAVLEDLSGSEATSRQRRLAEVEAQIVDLESRLLKVDEMFVDGELGRDSYHRLKARYAGELVSARGALESLEEGGGDLEKHLAFAVGVFSRLGRLFRDSHMEVQHTHLGSIFPEKLVFDSGKVRTLGESDNRPIWRKNAENKRRQTKK
ncbi:MAG: hypothetical protein ACR2GR_03135 [Rhodothermales bacterium]